MLIVLARVGFLLVVSFIGGILLGWISLESETPRLEAAMFLHQTQHKDNSRVAADSARANPSRATMIALFMARSLCGDPCTHDVLLRDGAA
jgi:hypothetical protein